MIQLEESLYEQLRTLAFEKGLSLSLLIRELLAKALGRVKPKKKRRIDSFKFIGCIRSGKRDISERHDDYLAEGILK